MPKLSNKEKRRAIDAIIHKGGCTYEEACVYYEKMSQKKRKKLAMGMPVTITTDRV